MGSRKAAEVSAPAPLVRIVEVLAEVSGDGNPDAWRAEAERMAETMRGQVTRDWRGHPCLGWVDAERLLLRMRRDQAQRNEEIEAQLVAADAARRALLPAGIPAAAIPEGMTGGLLMMAADPMRGSRRQSVLEHALEHPAGAIVYTPIGEDAP
jgi:anti-sigma factor RsiW